MSDHVGKHSEEAAEKRGVWLRWHNGADVGSTPGFRHGGKSAPCSKYRPDTYGTVIGVAARREPSSRRRCHGWD